MNTVNSFSGSYGNTAVEFGRFLSPQYTSSGRMSATIDPIDAALAMRALRVATSSMKRDFYQSTVFSSLA